MKNFDAVVIGSGPGGYVCAIRLAQLGKKTAVIEKDKVGGVCLNVGCIPSKALIHAAKQYYNAHHEFEEIGVKVSEVKLDLPKMQEWKSGVVKKLTGGVATLLKANGVEVIKGTASFKDSKTIEVKGATNETVGAKNFVIATGSRTVELPFLKFNGKNIVSSTEALELTELPKKMLVIGGGFIGLEIGIAYAKLGSEVTVVEARDQILGNTDPELVGYVEKRMKKLGVTLLTKTKALGLKEKNPEREKALHLEVETPEGKKSLEANVILVSVGRKPNSDGIGLDKAGVQCDPRGNININQQGQTSAPGIYAIGDVSGAPQLAHRASMDGLIVAAGISGEQSFRDYKTVPWAVFSDPEIAVAGLSEDEVRKLGVRYRVGKFPWVANGRALSTNETEGIVKVLIKEDDGAILGAGIVGPEASNLIAEATALIEMGGTVHDLEKIIHTHPTLPEALPEAAEQAYFKAIHIYKPKR